MRSSFPSSQQPDCFTNKQTNLLPESLLQLPLGLLLLDNQPIASRAVQALNRQGISTLGVLLSYQNSAALRHIPGMGEKSAAQIQQIIDCCQNLQEINERLSYSESPVMAASNETLTIIDRAKQISTASHRRVVLCRLQGQTYRQCGTSEHMSASRAQQIYSRWLHRLPKTLPELKWIGVYKKYQLSCQEFSVLTGEPESTYYYLASLFGKQRSNRLVPGQALNDESFSEANRQKLASLLASDHLNIQGSPVKKSKSAILNFLIKSRCQVETTTTQLEKYYHGFLEEFQLHGPEYTYSQQYINSCNSWERNIIYCGHRTFRYYNYDRFNFATLINDLQLEKYHGLEIGAGILYRRNKRLMEKYDIRSENELHNLLKQLQKNYQILNLQSPELMQADIKRMPILCFGKIRRMQQMENLLAQTAPISREDFLRLYEKEYGLSPSTISAIFQHLLQKHYGDGSFS